MPPTPRHPPTHSPAPTDMTINSSSTLPLGGACPYYMYKPAAAAASSAASSASTPAAAASGIAGNIASSSTTPRTRLSINKAVEPSPLALPTGLPRASIQALSVRLTPGAAPHLRSCLVAAPAHDDDCNKTPRPAYLLLHQLTKAKDRVRIWLAQVLRQEEEEVGTDVYTLASSTHVVIKESDVRFIRQYGRLWGEDPVSEVSALLRLQVEGGHANVVPLHAAFEGTGPSTDMLYIVLPHLAGDELFYQVTTAPGHQGLGEDGTRPLFRQVLAGLLHMKETQGLRHGDVSPENVMVGPDGHVTLIDLGMAECVPAASSSSSSSSSPPLLEARPRRGKKQYMAPEIYEEVAYDAFAADVWALGALLYVCWTGCTVYRSPFDSHFLNLKHPQGLQHLLEEREANGSTRALSPEAKDLLQGMLAWRFERRLTLEEIAAHPWVTALLEEEEEEEGTDSEEEEVGEMAQLLLLSNSSSVSSLSMFDSAAEEEEEEEEEEETAPPSPAHRPSTPLSSTMNSSSASSSPYKPPHSNNCDHEDNSASSLQSMHAENNLNIESNNNTDNNCCASFEEQQREEEEEDMRTVSTAFSSSLDSTLSLEC